MYDNTSFHKLSDIFSEFETHPCEYMELFKYYESELHSKIQHEKIDRYIIDQVIDFMILSRKVNEFSDKRILSSLIETKNIEIRSMTLDILNDNFYEDNNGEPLRSPDAWILDIIEEINDIFRLQEMKNSSISQKTSTEYQEGVKYRKIILNLFLEKLTVNIEKVFLGAKKFKQMGNQLVLNLIYFHVKMSHFVRINDEFINRVYENIEMSHRLDLPKIYEIVQSQYQK